MAKKKQFVTAAAAFAVAASAVAPAITADAATKTVRLSSDYVRVGDLDATLDKTYNGGEIHWYKSSVDLNKLGVFQTAKGFVKGQGIRVEKRVRVLNYAQEIKPESEFVFEQGVPVSGIRVQPVLFADGNEYAKPVSVAGFNTDKVGEFEGTLTYANRAYGVVTKKVKYKVVNSTPMVEEVKAINAKQLQVTFNKSIDADSVITDAGTDDALTSAISIVAADTDAVAISAANLEGSLSKDGKTLTITNIDAAEYFDGNYTVTVDGAKTLDGKEVEAFITKLSADDAVAPTVTEVSYDAATDEVTVALSEAIIANPSVLRVNGAPVAFTNASAAPVTELTFARPASVVTGSAATVYIAGATDFNGNALTAFNGSVTFTKDASALGVSAFSQADSDTLTVQFNKKLGGATPLADLEAALTLVVDGATFSDYEVVATPGDTTGTKFDINFTSSTLYGTATSENLTVLLAKDGLEDLYGNTNPATTSAVKMVKDTVAPTVTGTSVSTDKKTMTVSFSEGVTVSDVAKFIVRRDGIATSGLTIAVDVDDAKKVHITNTDDSAFTAGTYSIRIEAGAVEDLVEGNVNALTTATASVTAGTSTTTNLVSAVSNGTNANTFEVSFSDNGTGKEVTTAALNASNYKLDGKALPANTDIYFKDATKQVVVIELPAGSINIGEVGAGTSAILSVSDVKSVDGKTVVSSSSTVEVEDNTAATLTSATKSGNSVIVTFSEAINQTGLDATDFVVTDSTGTVVADYTPVFVAGNSKQVQINFTAIPAGALTVETAPTIDLTDANLFDVAVGSQVVAR